MRSVSLLVLLGAYLAQGLSLERRGLGSEDIADKFESDFVERDGEPLAAQHPLARPDDSLGEKNNIDPNLNPVDHPIDSAEPSVEQNPGSEDNHSGIHPILKRVPSFITFIERFTTAVLVTRLRSGSATFTEGSATFVTVTDESAPPRTVTSVSFIPVTSTEFLTEGGPVYQLTAPPASATEEFLTSAYLAESLVTTFTVARGVPARFTVTRPPTVTITESPSTVTVTRSVTFIRRILQTVSLPVITRNIVLPGCCACPAPTNTVS